jgi:hypothetical protein
MVKTNKWTNQELLKYILSPSNKLQSDEVDQLKLLPAFSKEGVTNGTRFKISELYEPLDVFRTLGPPIIDWKGEDGKIKWYRGSGDGMPIAVQSHSGY